MSAVQDTNGVYLSYAYDAANRLTSVTYDDGTSVSYTYNRLDLLSITDSNGHTTQRKVDGEGEIYEVDEPWRPHDIVDVLAE